MDAILTQHGHLVAYPSEITSYVVQRYPTYDIEMYSIMQAYHQSKQYILGKEMIPHIRYSSCKCRKLI